MFSNISVGLDTPCLYQLSIRSPGPNAAEYATFTFPLTPSMLRSFRTALKSRSDVRGPYLAAGVTRVMDKYGLTPPTFLIEGTTGWDRHNTDGYVLSGKGSASLLQTCLQLYETLNQQQLAQGNSSLYTLEFYDFFTPQFWQIEPVGPQEIRQANDKPLLVFYRLRWDAIAPVGEPLEGEIDAIAQVLEQPVAVAALGAVTTLMAVTALYTPLGTLGLVTL